MKTTFIYLKSDLFFKYVPLENAIMKKILMFTILLIGLTMSSQAQSLSGGVKAGGNYINLSKFPGDKHVALYHAGAFLNIALGNVVSIQAEGLLSRQGYNDEFQSDIRERTMYINTPLLLKCRILPKFSVMAGGRAGFVLSAKVHMGEEEDGIDKIDVKGDYESIDYGGVVGAEYALTDRLSVGATANIGFGNYRIQPKQSRQNVYQLSASYRIFKF